METQYFKMIGQKTAGKLVLIAVVDENMLGEVPSIFELQAMKLPATVYTGTYPQIKLNTDTLKDVTERCAGLGISGILTEEEWYCKSIINKDILGISI